MANKKAILIYPNSLFEENDLLSNDCDIYLLEDDTYFTKFKFHKMKLVLHRASMVAYFDYLKSLKYKTKYIDLLDTKHFYNKIISGYDEILLYDVIDHPLRKKISNICKKNKIKLSVFDSKLFMETLSDLVEYNKTIKKKNYVHNSFYKWQRRRLDLLVDDNGNPMYGKWSFDKENRQPFDDKYKEPTLPKINKSLYVTDAIRYVNKHFSDNFGLTDNFIYPVTFDEAKKLLDGFIKNKIKTFGEYEDAVADDIDFGSHSLLSSSLNIGIITPKFVIEFVMKYFNKLTSGEKKRQINSTEGFIRQIIGWRSFTRLMYEFHGGEMIKMNRLKHKLKINNKWFKGETSIPVIDHLIKKAEKYAYMHHIERLMYIGNFSLLTNIDPIEIYKWFMIVSIDSYEWVMVSNVMGMSQWTLKDMTMMTRPYFSSSNYIGKMSNFKCDKKNSDDDWCKIWDALYYKFISDNYDVLRKNYATVMMVKHLSNMEKSKINELLSIAKKYLKYLHK